MGGTGGTAVLCGSTAVTHHTSHPKSAKQAADGSKGLRDERPSWEPDASESPVREASAARQRVSKQSRPAGKAPALALPARARTPCRCYRACCSREIHRRRGSNTAHVRSRPTEGSEGVRLRNACLNSEMGGGRQG